MLKESVRAGLAEAGNLSLTSESEEVIWQVCTHKFIELNKFVNRCKRIRVVA